MQQNLIWCEIQQYSAALSKMDSQIYQLGCDDVVVITKSISVSDDWGKKSKSSNL